MNKKLEVMTKTGTILLLFSILIGCNSKAQNEVKRYEIKSGIVEYTSSISGKVMGSTISGSGTQNLYFKEYGAVEIQEEESTQTTTTKLFGTENSDTKSTHTMNKLENGTSYSVDFKQKQIYANRNMAMDMIAAFHPEADAGEVGKGMLEDLGGEITGHENVLGYNCEIWTLAGGKQWIYKGVMLKMEMTTLGITTITKAKSAKFNSSVPDKYFQLPNFPIQKTESLGNAGSLFEDIGDMENSEDMDAQMEKISKMSYEEWKKEALKNDEEMQQMSDEELRETYDMIQKMMNLSKN